MDLIPLSIGLSGRYNLWGVPVAFVDVGTPWITKFALGILGGQYVNVLVHEMGHALFHFAFTGRIGRVSVISNGDGNIMYDRWKYIYQTLTPTQEVIRSFGGAGTEIVFCLMRSIGISRYETWLKKRQNGAIGRYQHALLTLLKVQNALGVFGTWIQPISLLLNHNLGSDFQNIYKYGGMSSAIGATALIGIISALTIKIMRDDIPVEQPLRSKVYNSIKTTIERALNAVYQVNLIAMGVMKSAIDLLGSPLVVQMKAKRLETPNHS